jgi:hypothetical protein
MELPVKIVPFVEECQPSIVEAVVLDSARRRHSFVDKVAIFTADWLDTNCTYSHPGVILCEVLSR